MTVQKRLQLSSAVAQAVLLVRIERGEPWRHGSGSHKLLIVTQHLRQLGVSMQQLLTVRGMRQKYLHLQLEQERRLTHAILRSGGPLLEMHHTLQMRLVGTAAEKLTEVGEEPGLHTLRERRRERRQHNLRHGEIILRPPRGRLPYLRHGSRRLRGLRRSGRDITRHLTHHDLHPRRPEQTIVQTLRVRRAESPRQAEKPQQDA